MPFALPDPLAPKPRDDSASSRYPELARALADLRQRIVAAKAEEELTAPDGVKANAYYNTVRGSLPALRDIHVEYADAVMAVWRDNTLSDVGRQQRIDQAAAKRQAAIERIADKVLSQCGDFILAEFPEPVFATAPSDVIGEISLILQSFSLKTAETFATEAIAALRRASDPMQSPINRFRDNCKLYHAYGPLIARRVDAPESFAKPLAGISADLGDLIAMHLDTVLHGERHRVAVDFVNEMRTDFVWANTHAMELGGWDVAIEVGVRSFGENAKAIAADEAA